MENVFNEEELLNQIHKINEKKKILFGLFIAERLFPNYVAFSTETKWGEPKIIRNILDLIWESLNTDLSLKEFRTASKKLSSIIPDTEDFETVLVSYALDSCVAVSSLLDFCIEKDEDSIVIIASESRDSVDLFVQELENMSDVGPTLEKRILEHPIMQNELFVQRQALIYLIETNVDNQIIEELHVKWCQNAKSNIGFDN